MTTKQIYVVKVKQAANFSLQLCLDYVLLRAISSELCYYAFRNSCIYAGCSIWTGLENEKHQTILVKLPNTNSNNSNNAYVSSSNKLAKLFHLVG